MNTEDKILEHNPIMVNRRLIHFPVSTIRVNESTEAETIEQQIERMIQNKEPIKERAQLLYTERQDGVKAETNIRTDRWEIAIDATTKIQKSYKAKREERAEKAKKDGEPESVQGTPDETGKSPKLE